MGQVPELMQAPNLSVRLRPRGFSPLADDYNEYFVETPDDTWSEDVDPIFIEAGGDDLFQLGDDERNARILQEMQLGRDPLSDPRALLEAQGGSVLDAYKTILRSTTSK
jgi:hypothetical protein